MKLLEEGYIGGLRLRNRIKFASTTTCYCTEEGRVTEQEKKWLEERAKGGAGVVTTGIAHVTPWGRLNSRMLVPCLINCVSLFGNLIFDNALSFYAALARSCEPLMTASTNRM